MVDYLVKLGKIFLGNRPSEIFSYRFPMYLVPINVLTLGNSALKHCYKKNINTRPYWTDYAGYIDERSSDTLC